MSASAQGALAFQKGLGCVHSLSHSLGGVNPRLHHGTLNAMFLPAVVRFNASAESIQREQRLQAEVLAGLIDATQHIRLSLGIRCPFGHADHHHQGTSLIEDAVDGHRQGAGGTQLGSLQARAGNQHRRI